MSEIWQKQKFILFIKSFDVKNHNLHNCIHRRIWAQKTRTKHFVGLCICLIGSTCSIRRIPIKQIDKQIFSNRQIIKLHQIFKIWPNRCKLKMVFLLVDWWRKDICYLLWSCTHYYTKRACLVRNVSRKQSNVSIFFQFHIPLYTLMAPSGPPHNWPSQK